MRPSRDSSEMCRFLTRPVTPELLSPFADWLSQGLSWFLCGSPSCLVTIPPASTTLQQHQAHWTKASVQVNEELAGYPGARISHLLPDLQQSRLKVLLILHSTVSPEIQSRTSRPRSSRISSS